MRGPPVSFQELGQVIARVLQSILVEYDVEHGRIRLRELFGVRQLLIHYARLFLSFVPCFDESLQHFGGADLQVDNDGRQRGLEQLRGMIDAVTIEHNQLQKLGQFKYSFDLVLHFGNGGRAS